MIKAILFDFDDTLGNREVYSYHTVEERLDTLQVPYTGVERESLIQHIMILEQHGDVHKSYVRDVILNTYGIDLGEDYNEWWKAQQPKHTVVFDDAKEVLEYLKTKEYKIGVVTNGGADTQNEKLRLSGLMPYFDSTLVSEEAGYKKPDPHIFWMMAERLNVKPEECSFVGDMFHRDILGAYHAGMKPIWIWTHGKRLCNCKDIPTISCLSDLKELF